MNAVVGKSMCEANPANSMKRKNRDPEAVAADVDDDQLAKLIRSARPSVAIFDLDSTLWDGNVEITLRMWLEMARL